MGRVRQSHTKRIARELLELHPDKFSTDFEKNREALEELLDLDSKSLRNRIAGYLTTLLKQREG